MKTIYEIHSNVKFVTTVAHKAQLSRDIMNQLKKKQNYSKVKFNYSCEQSTALKRHIAVHEGTITKYIIIR